MCVFLIVHCWYESAYIWLLKLMFVFEHFRVVFNSRTWCKVVLHRRISIREFFFTTVFHLLRLFLPLIASNVYWQWEQRELSTSVIWTLRIQYLNNTFLVCVQLNIILIGFVLKQRVLFLFYALLEFSISNETKV